MNTADRLQRMMADLNNSGHLRRIGQLFSETVLFQVGSDEFFLFFEKGRIVGIESGPSKKIPWRFALRSDAFAMNEFWKPKPAPGYHDIFGLVKFGKATIDGDILILVKNLRFFKEVLALGKSRE